MSKRTNRTTLVENNQEDIDKCLRDYNDFGYRLICVFPSAAGFIRLYFELVE